MSYFVLFTGVVIVGLMIGWAKYKKSTSKKMADIPLKDTGNRIVVHFAKCVIKTRDYYEEDTSDAMPSRVEMLDSLYRSNQEAKKIKKIVSIIIFKGRDETGKPLEFRSEPIYMSGESLRAYLENKKETILYVDPGNFKRYYFDTEFLYTQEGPIKK